MTPASERRQHEHVLSAQAEEDPWRLTLSWMSVTDSPIFSAIPAVIDLLVFTEQPVFYKGFGLQYQLNLSFNGLEKLGYTAKSPFTKCTTKSNRPHRWEKDSIMHIFVLFSLNVVKWYHTFHKAS